MAKRNPFRTLESVGRIIGYSIIIAIFAFAVVALGAGVSIRYGWGWWGLLLIVAVPVALIVMAMIGGLLRLAADTIHDAWLMAKWRWDDRHPVDAEEAS
jgi:Ca2+/H+ antiporter